MVKVIQDPDHLIDSFATAFGEGHRDLIASAFSRYISDVAIAVKPEDIAAQAIAWASSHDEFEYEPIDIDVDGDRYVFIQNTLLDNLDIVWICDYIEKNWDANSTISGQIIFDALLERYDGGDLTDIVSAIVADYEFIGANDV